MILFAPFAVFYIKIVSHSHSTLEAVSYSKVATSVAVFLGKLFEALILKL